MTDAKYACSQNHSAILTILLTDMRVCAQKIKNSIFVLNPRHCYEKEIMEVDGK